MFGFFLLLVFLLFKFNSPNKHFNYKSTIDKLTAKTTKTTKKKKKNENKELYFNLEVTLEIKNKKK